MPHVTISTPTYRMSRTWVRNGPGRRVPHPFRFEMARIISNTDPGAFTLQNGGAGTHFGSLPDAVKARIYSKMLDRSYVSMQLGADIGEYEKTLALVSKALRAVRSPLRTVGDLMRKTARRLGKRSSRLLLKDSAEAFLEFQYGVRPLMGSIQDACSILKQPFPRNKVRYGPTPFSYSTRPYSANGGPRDLYYYFETATYTGSARAGFSIQLTNPNLFSVNQMGLLNPASITWELVPFSFVVDWFVPIGKYVNSLSDYAGCSRSDAFFTYGVRGQCRRAYPNRGMRCTDENFVCCRELTLPALPPIITQFKWQQSKEHIANALALIAGILPKTSR